MGSLGSSFVRDDALAYVGHLGSSQPSGVRKVLLLLLLLLSIPTRAKDIIYFTLQHPITSPHPRRCWYLVLIQRWEVWIYQVAISSGFGDAWITHSHTTV